jgi:hypothetical protein
VAASRIDSDDAHAQGYALNGAPFVLDAGRREIRRAANLLQQAFDDEPVQRWLYPVRPFRILASELWFRSILVSALADGRVQRMSDFSSVAVWLGPLAQSSRSNRWTAALRTIDLLAGRPARIRRELDRQLATARPRQAHWYLAAVATRVGCRGEGRGRAILAPVLSACDEQSVLAYLETSEPRSVPFYEALGFAVWSSFSVCGGPDVWTMGRLPLRTDGPRELSDRSAATG